jgi:hypothetical protein
MANDKEKKYEIKVNKKHGGKEFRSYFRFLGQVKPIRKKEEGSENWVDQPLYEQKKTRTDKWRRVLQFEIETAKGNGLRLELAGMEQEFVYPYSSKHKKSIKVKWANKEDKTKWKDENGKVPTKEIDDSYHAIATEWDKAKSFAEMVKAGDWVEIKGYYDPNEFKTDEGEDRNTLKRIITSITPIVDGKLQVEGEEPKAVFHEGKEITYVTDFSSPDFKEVNYFSMQIGIRSTYQDETTKDTKVNGTLLTYGKDRSEPKDVELMVYYKEPEKGKSLAEAFASLEQRDFIEATGQDNNRATYTYVEIEEEIPDDDPFADVDDTQKVKRKQRVTNGEKKGLEVTGYVAGSIMRGLLTEEEMRKTVETTSEAPFDTDSESDPFGDVDGNDPFSD